MRISTDAGQERFDKAIIACHANQALAMLATPTRLESSTLGAIRTQPNRAVLHTDVSVRHCYLLDAPRYGVEQRASKVLHVSPFLSSSGALPFSPDAHFWPRPAEHCGPH